MTTLPVSDPPIAEERLAAFDTTRYAEAEARRAALNLTPGTLTEIICHGDYYHRREIAAVAPVSAYEFECFITGSPYIYKITAETLARMLSEVNATGRTELGWSDFHLE